jgi:hypothetical protein
MQWIDIMAAGLQASGQVQVHKLNCGKERLFMLPTPTPIRSFARNDSAGKTCLVLPRAKLITLNSVPANCIKFL